jgi:hypothetical protein
VVSALCIRLASNDQTDAFDFMGGESQYKDTWSKSGFGDVDVDR